VEFPRVHCHPPTLATPAFLPMLVRAISSHYEWPRRRDCATRSITAGQVIFWNVVAGSADNADLRAAALWPNKGKADLRPRQGQPTGRLAPIAPECPAVPADAPATLRGCRPSSRSGPEFAVMRLIGKATAAGESPLNGRWVARSVRCFLASEINGWHV
jgi:hypothetical protein